MNKISNGVPVVWRCDEPEEMKDLTIGKVISYDPETQKITAVLDDKHAEYISRLLNDRLPISLSCRVEPAEPVEFRPM